MLGGINPLMLSARRGPTTWNPLDKDVNIALSNGNLTASGAGFTQAVRATAFQSAGKLYFEVILELAGTTGAATLGVANAAASLNNYVGQNNDSISYEAAGNVLKNGVKLATQTTYTNGDVVGVAVDFSLAKIWFAKNNTFVGDPSSGGGGYSISGMGALAPAASPAARLMTLNVSTLFTPPSGFAAWG